MTIVPFTIPSETGSNIVTNWTGLTGGDTGAPMPYSSFADKTVQCFGTIGAAITMQGSNDPRVISDAGNANWFTLTNNLGASIAFAAAGGMLIAEAPLYIRPNCSAGTTSATVIINANQS
jgi:hypothetical protein